MPVEKVKMPALGIGLERGAGRQRQGRTNLDARQRGRAYGQRRIEDIRLRPLSRTDMGAPTYWITTVSGTVLAMDPEVPVTISAYVPGLQLDWAYMTSVALAPLARKV